MDSEPAFIIDIGNFQPKNLQDATMNSQSAKPEVQALALLAVALVLTLIFASPLVSAQTTQDAATEQTEYTQFVHTYLNSIKGNYTSVGKPMFPIYFNDSQIPIGSRWSITEPLVAGHNYHVYIYGDWVNNGSTPKTDYDIYVYDPRGILESEHTEAAGLPEHLGTRVNDTFFTPKTTGNYTFTVENDARQSNGTQAATFMAIENLECNQWTTATIEGNRPDGSSAVNTAWAYEFVTNASNIQITINVPNTLDMYEARLYKMSSPESLIINDAPLPWEPGLYGNLSGSVGGYNLNSDGYRGVAYASCEFKGQDMQLTYNASTATQAATKTTTKTSAATATASASKTLYQLVLIGEVGYGKVDLLIKTQFNETALMPSNTTKLISRVGPENQTTLTYTSNGTALTNAVLQYTTDQWKTTHEAPMQISSQTCSGTIPKQAAGTHIQYCISANDIMLNNLTAEGEFTVKQPAILNITVPQEISIGQNITVTGQLTGVTKNASIQLRFMTATFTQDLSVQTQSSGAFTANFQPNGTGVWAVQASFGGDNQTFPAEANMMTVSVEEPPFYVKNATILGGGGFFGVVALGLVYYIKKRRQ